MDIVGQCNKADIPVFVKQIEVGTIRRKVSHNPKEWPVELRIQQLPAGEENE
jgi:hypothetical protein